MEPAAEHHIFFVKQAQLTGFAGEGWALGVVGVVKGKGGLLLTHLIIPHAQRKSPTNNF